MKIVLILSAWKLILNLLSLSTYTQDEEHTQDIQFSLERLP